MRTTRFVLIAAVALGLLAPAGAAAASGTPIDTAARAVATRAGHSNGHADGHDHSHGPGPLHVDPPPAGVDVTAHLSSATILRRSGVAHRPAKFRRGQLGVPGVPGVPGPGAGSPGAPTTSADAGAAVSVLDVPPGQPGNPTLSEHMSPVCTGTGTDGARVQVLYARESSQASRLDSVRPALLSDVADVDDTFALSSADGDRRVRWVTDSQCVPVIREVVVPDGTFSGGDGLDAIQAAAVSAGIQVSARKLLTFADANSLCGIGQVWQDDTSSTANLNNVSSTMVARVDVPCWQMYPGSHSTPAHELMHTLGAVQATAPNSTTLGHCTDEYDVMCYADGGLTHAGTAAVMSAVCPRSHEALFDCGNDDYFSTEPPPGGSYLATHWNTARSHFLDTAWSYPWRSQAGAASTGCLDATGAAAVCPSITSVSVGNTWIRGSTSAPIRYPVRVVVDDPAGLATMVDTAMGRSLSAMPSVVIGYGRSPQPSSTSGTLKTFDLTVSSPYGALYPLGDGPAYGGFQINPMVWGRNPTASGDSADTQFLAATYRSGTILARSLITNTPSSTAVRKAQYFTVRGRLTRFDGSAQPGQKVNVYYVPAGQTRASFAGAVTTRWDGTFSLPVRSWYTGSWFVNFPGSPFSAGVYKGVWVRVS
ncbi:MAG TPA: hypothetical protein VHO27_03110 [Angustibacter sp.]|nr:hypothetical protein [Angustibacter sp.]